jgi:hypothetical protein
MTTNNTTYNGWSNYETWLVNLWLTNEQSTQDFLEHRRSILSNGNNPHKEDLFASLIREYVEQERETWHESAASLWNDLINAALQQVDWREIARAYLEQD